MQLFEKDSLVDLFLRGFSRADIERMTGVDIGYAGCSFRSMVIGVDRKAYQAEFVRSNCDVDTFLDLLNKYGDKVISKSDVLAGCGLSGDARIGLRQICDVMGLSEEYAVIHLRECRNRTDIRKATMLARYGAPSSFESPELREKAKATLLARYGVEHQSKSPVIRKKICDTMLSRYGVKNTFESSELREKARATMRERYGVDYTFESPELFERFKATMRERYGAEFMRQCPALVEKATATCVLHYGVENCMQSPVVQDKAARTTMLRYGVRYQVLAPEFAQKARNTCLAKYGKEYYAQTDEFRSRVIATSQERYGTDYPMQNEDIYRRFMVTMQCRYGVTHPLQLTDFLKKSLDTKRLHGTFHTSQAEDSLYDMLVERFGSGDVERQYFCDRYPFACDFYVKSRDMFIELNGFVSHGCHWFGSGIDDVERFSAALESGISVCAYGDGVWVGSDVDKRCVAKQNNLNYVVFWGDEGQDVDLWFAMGCPDGRDWERMYSWLPERDLIYDGDWPEKLSVTGKSIPAAVRMANWREFYKRELALWDLNYDNKWGTVQARLYANRLKYVHKLPDELTNREILRGLNIAGMVRAYSHFDNSGMAEFLRDYDIKSLYDPCAGWGERMLTCMAAGVEYAGTDINPAVVDAHMLLLDRYREYAGHGAAVMLGDSAERDMTSGTHEAVFTCPPYGDREIYTASGAENLDQDAFLDWWRRVIEHSVSGTTRAFAYQIEQVWKDRMNAVLESMGWRLDRQIQVGRNRVSHMTRSRGDGTKHNFEEVQVFVR